MQPVHDRMPVILLKRQHPLWLNPAITNAKGLIELLKPLPNDALQMFPVTTKVGNPRFEDPSCVEAIRLVQSSL